MSNEKTTLYYVCPKCGDVLFMYYPPNLKCEKCGSEMKPTTECPYTQLRPKVIAVDFDGTLCENKWPYIGAPHKLLIKGLKQRQKNGDKLILWTCRMGERLEAAIEWCKQQGLEFDAINENLPETIKAFGGDSRKICADEYIDDKAVRRGYERTSKTKI